MALLHTTACPCQWFPRLAGALDPRSAPRLASLFLGAVLATGRRTVTAWIRAAGLSADYRPAYTALAAAGKRADLIAVRLIRGAVGLLLADADRLTFGIDDTPTPRYGRHVEGAGIHHNPTPGPAGGAFLYGHVWVVLAWLGEHPRWGTIALPLLARLYIRKKDLPAVPEEHRPAFRTKLEQAVELVGWAKEWLGRLGKPLWVVADGAYAKAAFLKPLQALNVTVVSRLRKDAALCTVPGPRPPGRRGRPRTYGAQRIELAKRGGQERGWQTGAFDLYGEPTIKTYKTFLATWRPAGGAIRVVLVREEHEWVAFFSTDPAATVADVLESIAARFSLETAFRDVKEIVGAGQQQVRYRWASVGAWHLCLWAYTLTEAWAWGQADAALVDRAQSPWDREARRPSHADKRRAWRRQLLGEEIRGALQAGAGEAEIANIAARLLNLAA